METVFLDVLVGFVTGFMVLETLLGGEACHAHVQAGEIRMPVWIGGYEFLVLQHRLVQFHDINMVVDFRLGAVSYLIFSLALTVIRKALRTWFIKPNSRRKCNPESESLPNAN